MEQASLQFFGLAREPFSPVADPGFLYAGESFCDIRTQLAEALAQGEGPILVLGGAGTGKTTLFRSLLDQPDPALFLSVVTNPFLTTEDLLRQVLHDFGMLSGEPSLGPSAKSISCSDLVVALQRFVESLASIRARAVILIDDAHQVDHEVLAQLAALMDLRNVAATLRLVLVGEPKLDVILADLQEPPERGVRRFVLQPLSPADTRLYLDHRLDTAATDPAETTDRALLTPAGVAMIARLSGGVPRAINLLGARMLDVGYERRNRRITPAMVIEAARRVDVPIPAGARLQAARPARLAAVGSVLVAVVLAGAAWQSGRLQLPERFARIRRAPATASVPAQPPTPASAPALSTTASVEPAAPGPLAAADSYVVVVASFKTAQHAEDLRSRFNAVGLPAFTRVDADGQWRLVLIGPYLSAEEANAIRGQIGLTEFKDSHVRRQPAE